MLVAAFALVLAAAPLEDSLGGAGALPADGARRATRLRMGLGGAALFGTASFSQAGGIGVSIDVGAVFDDRFSLLLHGEVGTVVVTLIGSGAVMAEYALGDHVSAGVGVAFSKWALLLSDSFVGSLGFSGVTFPLRLNLAPLQRRFARD